VVPLLGARKVDQLRDNLGALEVSLSAEQTARLDAVSAIERGFPHDFLGKEEIRDVIYGGGFGDLDFPDPGALP
jgi:hypothetical protein